MLRHILTGTICLFAAVTLAAAVPAKAVTAMEEPLPGDFWTYEVRDEITGKISATRKNVITEVTPSEVAVRVSIVGTEKGGMEIYDRSWNLKSRNPWRYTPNDGTGVRSPLKTGATWKFKADEVNSGQDNIWMRSGTSKVTGQETLTTKAGTFETFKIETSLSAHLTKDPTRKAEVVLQTWYAPAIDHWVKRSVVTRVDKYLRNNDNFELIEYGRRN